MKVCHMTSVHDSMDDRIFLREATAAAEAGYETYIVAPGKSDIQKGVHIEGIGNWNVSRLQRMLLITRKIYRRALEIDADIYQFHDPELLPIAMKLKKKKKVVFYDSHEDVPRQILAKDWLPFWVRRIISNCFELYEKKIARRLDCVIAATPHIAEIFKNKGAESIVVRNYPLLEDIHGENGDYEERENIICYAGGLTEQRGITQLVKVLGNLEAKLELAGDIEKNYLEELQKLPGFSKVKMLGFLNRAEIEKLYNRSRIGMAVLKKTPNHINSLAIKLFEYMAAGIPVICSDFPLWKEIIEGNKCGICVDPEDTKTIVKNIVHLFENDELAKTMGDNGKKAVKDKYNWNVEKNNLIKTYKSFDQYYLGDQL